ncbi:hypothetical protein KSP39_PZI003686 [Platanthera zijinensis]|uniref:Uncharacterized protein n=1 Tax=Platanthera zijinensis TaxID=2320716 RepID=A0AAP0GCP8_9ASPA
MRQMYAFRLGSYSMVTNHSTASFTTGPGTSRKITNKQFLIDTCKTKSNTRELLLQEMSKTLCRIVLLPVRVAAGHNVSRLSATSFVLGVEAPGTNLLRPSQTISRGRWRQRSLSQHNSFSISHYQNQDTYDFSHQLLRARRRCRLR